MGIASDTRKTEHAGAKNGGGAWCRRAEAKYASRKRRRRNDKAAINSSYATDAIAKT